MRISFPVLFLGLAACGGDTNGPSVSGTLTAVIDDELWRAGGNEARTPPSATYFTGDQVLTLSGIDDRPGGDGNIHLTISIATDGTARVYALGDTASESYSKVIVTIGSLWGDSTARTEWFFTNVSVSGVATIASLDLDGRHSTGSFHFDLQGGQMNRIMTVTGGSWDLPLRIIQGSSSQVTTK